MKTFITSWWGLGTVLVIFILVGISIKDLSMWTILQYYKTILHPDKFSAEVTGQIGDTIGGTTAPFIALSAGFLTFIAFWAQMRANTQVQDQFKIQQFESQYFEMIRLHKENVNEMKISGYHFSLATSFVEGKSDKTKTISRTQIERVIDGRKVFVTMLNELNACYEFCQIYAKDFNLDQKTTTDIAYRIFFFGIFSPLAHSKEQAAFLEFCRKKLEVVRKQHKSSSAGINVFTVNAKKVKLHIKYAPFSGHESRLAHYYRHLFSTVKFVVKKEAEGLFNYDQAREYLKILRAQMSNDEQILLYHNYISGMGADWDTAKNPFLSKYRMLHNLPIDNVKFVERPRSHFKTKIQQMEQLSKSYDPMFEWGDYEEEVNKA